MSTEEKEMELLQEPEERVNSKTIWKYMREHLEIWASVGAIWGVVFELGCYIYSMGRYDFWNIPYEYIDSNKEGIFFRFVLFMMVGLVILIISTMYMYYIKEKTVEKTNLKKLCIFLQQFIKIMVYVVVVYIVILWIFYSLNEAIMYIVNDLSRFIKQVFFATVIICCSLVGMGMFGIEITSLDGEFCKENVNYKENKKQYLIAALLIVAAIGVILYFIYDSGMKYAGNMRKITVATIQETEYVVVDKCNDKWVVKKCIKEDGRWQISRSHCMLSDLQEVPLEIRFLENGDSLSNHLNESKEREIKGIIVNGEDNMKINFISWCNENEGFLSAILSILTILISGVAMCISYRVGKLPYIKNISMIPRLYLENDNFYINLTIINTGNAPICIDGITISNKEMLDIGVTEDSELFVLKPSEHVRKTFRLYDDLENIAKHQLDLNGHIVLTAYDVSGKKYQFTKGFPVG